MPRSCCTVRVSTAFPVCTMMAIPSTATLNSTGVKPAACADAISVDLICREAWATSTCPLMSAVMPVLLPPPDTSTSTFSFRAM